MWDISIQSLWTIVAYIIKFLPTLILLAYFLFFFYNYKNMISEQGDDFQFSITLSDKESKINLSNKASINKPLIVEEKPITLNKIVGLESVKKEIKYYLDFINNREKYMGWNVKLPKGILLVGPPGTGKTLLVKTLAEACNLPVIHTSGSEFVEMYVGVGASRVRKLFKNAREYKRCIIFIDEIDAVGGKRNSYGSHSERDSTLNQLLVEMDGFNETNNILVFAATNLVKNLDSALLRSGRFDKKIYFDPPNKEEREKLYDLYLDDIEIEGCQLDKLAEMSSGLTGADIANICNQAKINAIQDENDVITYDNIEKALEEIMIGREKPERKMNKYELERVAHHEAGHALMGYLLKDSNPPIKVSILPRGESALGFSQSKPEDRKLYTQNFLKAQICVLLGGRVAEKIIYGNYSSGASDDIEKVTRIVKEWYQSWGMDSRSGPLNYSILKKDKDNSMTKKIIKFVKKLENYTCDVLTDYKNEMKQLAKLLLDKETINFEDIKNLLDNDLEDKIESIKN